MRRQRESQMDVNRWASVIARYTDITELDETILFELVERIEVGETQVIDGAKVRDVKVFYRYVGNIDDAVKA